MPRRPWTAQDDLPTVPSQARAHIEDVSGNAPVDGLVNQQYSRHARVSVIAASSFCGASRIVAASRITGSRPFFFQLSKLMYQGPVESGMSRPLSGDRP